MGDFNSRLLAFGSKSLVLGCFIALVTVINEPLGEDVIGDSAGVGWL
jgi:hypothetical protein